MRAIGKGSLASILSVGLHCTRIILIIALSGLTIAMVVVPFVPVITGIVGTLPGVDIDGHVDIGVDSGDFIKIAHHFVNFSVMLFVANRLLEILKTLRFGSPFVRENADRFRGVGYALLIGEGAQFGFRFLSMMFDADVDINSTLLSWLAIISVFVLAEVFHEGARMKEEQDLTV